MLKPLSIRKNFSWTFAASIISSACQWGMLMLMTKLLSKEQVGYYVLALAICTPVMGFCMLQLRAIQVTDAQNLYHFSQYFGASLLTNGLALLIVVGIILGFGEYHSLLLSGIIVLVALNKVIEATSDCPYGLMQKHERLDKVSQSIILRSVGGLLVFSLALYSSRDQLLAILYVAVWWLIVLLFFDRPNVNIFERFRPSFQLRPLLSLLWLGLPLGVVMGLMAFTESTPRYFVEGHLGPESLAIFGAMAYVVTGAVRAVIALGQAVAPRLAQYFFSNRQAYLSLLGKMLAVALAMSLATIIFGMLLGQQFLTLVYKKEYAQDPVVFFWLLVVAGVNMFNCMLGTGMTATRRFKSAVPVYAGSLTITFLVCWLLVPTFGLKGAAWGMLAGSLAVCTGSIFIIILALRSPLSSSTAQQSPGGPAILSPTVYDKAD